MPVWRALASRLSIVPLVALPVLAGCGKSAAPAAPAAPAPAEVGVVVARAGEVGVLTELPGRTEASRVAQVRARVAGILQKQLFREGSDVKPGQPLFRIDDAPYRAALASAQAALARAEANLLQTRAQAERYRPLAEAKAVSEQDYIAAQAAFKQSEADVAAGKAALQTAQINLGYAAVNAPIGGRIGRALVTEGALVGQGEATQLAVIQQIDPLYVNFTQSAAEVLRLRAAIAAGRFKRAGDAGAAPVRVLLEDGSTYPLPGKLLFSDLTVDAGTGQITLRAELPNPKGALLPGLYVRVQLEQAQASNAIVLPQQAVQRSSDGDRVFVVAPDGKVAPRPVKVSLGQERQWVVLEGLQGGEQVVVDGFQKIRPNATVKPVPWGAAASAAPAASAASR
ncbi:MAG: efflux RND transporter periplasmic adaptor subunit [Piscinibacter sp.]|uniref:efflux RND transporter periplasmic adaptor subunit n=1 Tax=Piscinibacter sp. TaxID=1903157 RepID=UPI00258FF614|nr:efflux RND transporter periplasmic adaptor subunit [Piscinibacter sp.]MCW5663407.1 efflux RND transporter periplasmic adaptor subunit [Piscinibacter sp.]